MHPFEKESPGLPAGVSSHLDVRLKTGWHLDRRRASLVSAGGEAVSLKRLLPAGARVVPMVPSLAGQDEASLTEDERHLARMIQVVLPAGADPGGLSTSLRELQGVERVSVPPQIGLP